MAVHDPRNLGDTAACPEKRQCMDRQLTQRYVVDKHHGNLMAQGIFRCQGLRQEELEWFKEPGEWWVWGSYRTGAGNQDSSFKATGSCSRMSCPIRLVLRLIQHLYTNASGQPFFQRCLPSPLQGILRTFNYPAPDRPDRPFYRRATSSAKHSNFSAIILEIG